MHGTPAQRSPSGPTSDRQVNKNDRQANKSDRQVVFYLCFRCLYVQTLTPYVILYANKTGEISNEPHL